MNGPIPLGAAYFAAVFAAGFVLGAIRQRLIIPVTGEFIAVAMELPLILGWSWLVCGWLLRRHALPAATARLTMGGTAFVLLMAAEFALSLAMGRPASAWLPRFRQAAELVGLLGQIAFAAIPLLR